MTVERAWLCENCDSIHDNEDAAMQCCSPLVQDGFMCDCGAFHHLKINALSCCNSDQTDEIYLTARELEAAGQLRLPI